ncbi:MAG: motility associated factor glycosyltransferase family protein [Candidatus Riflebacteria bacterium]|nr:motility associated factor glycosyltransferase family protein [Candidatus Riflebacteria bacterium]
MDSWLTQNLASVARHPALLAAMERIKHSPGPSEYRVETTKSGEKTLLVTSADGKTFTYHSRYDPVTEARRQVESSLENQTHVLMLGFGLGYASAEVLAKSAGATGERRIVIIEPDAKAFATALTSRDLRSILNDSRVQWCVGLTPDEVGDRWLSSLDWTALESLAIIEHPPSLSRNQSYFERIKEKIRYLCNRSKGNLVTLMHSGTDFHTNNFGNAAAIAEFPGVGRLFNRFNGVPAVIIAAGPSLEKNVRLLERVKGRFFIIATDTALRQLAARDIRPDVVCAADPCYENSLDFVGVEDEKDVVLAFEPMTHPDILKSFQGDKILMTFGGGLAQMFSKHREEIGNVVCWGSIATTAFDLARKCGCDPIIFIGLDLSFQDGKLYARGSYSDDIFYDAVHPYTSLEHETLDYIAAKGVFRFERPNGEILYTDYNMNMYRSWFEDQFRQTPGRSIINCTEGGVVSNHITCMPFEQAIDRFWDRGGPVKAILGEALCKPVRCEHAEIVSSMSDARRQLREMADEGREALSRLKKLLRRGEQILVKELSGDAKASFIDLLDLHDKLGANTLLMPWFSIHQTRFVTRHTMEINALKRNNSACLSEWAKELKAFFEAVIRFHDYQMPLLEEAIQDLQGKSGNGAGQKRASSTEELPPSHASDLVSKDCLTAGSRNKWP